MAPAHGGRHPEAGLEHLPPSPPRPRLRPRRPPLAPHLPRSRRHRGPEWGLPIGGCSVGASGELRLLPRLRPRLRPHTHPQVRARPPAASARQRLQRSRTPPAGRQRCPARQRLRRRVGPAEEDRSGGDGGCNTIAASVPLPSPPLDSPTRPKAAGAKAAPQRRNGGGGGRGGVLAGVLSVAAPFGLAGSSAGMCVHADCHVPTRISDGGGGASSRPGSGILRACACACAHTCAAAPARLRARMPRRVDVCSSVRVRAYYFSVCVRARGSASLRVCDCVRRCGCANARSVRT